MIRRELVACEPRSERPDKLVYEAWPSHDVSRVNRVVASSMTSLGYDTIRALCIIPRLSTRKRSAPCPEVYWRTAPSALLKTRAALSVLMLVERGSHPGKHVRLMQGCGPSSDTSEICSVPGGARPSSRRTGRRETRPPVSQSACALEAHHRHVHSRVAAH